MIHEERFRIVKKGEHNSGPVVYWMSRDQRVHDNWSLLFAQAKALQIRKPVVVVFCLVPEFLEATLKQYVFMIKGLQEVEESLASKNIPFYLLTGSPEIKIPEFLLEHNADALITDFDPLSIKKHWKKNLSDIVETSVYEIDAHNIVPCWAASPKQEYGAYTFRPRIYRIVSEYLEEFPELKKHPVPWKEEPIIEWKEAMKSLNVNTSVPEVDWIQPGEKAAHLMLQTFIREKLSEYAVRRNDPCLDGQSNLSPYLHFGHISSQRVALEVLKFSGNSISKEAFLEELIVRKELSDNFCYYNMNYDNVHGFPAWAEKTLNDHRNDPRDYLYSLDEFECGKTHDDLWNAAQLEMVKFGKMHGYMRMYWAKKILEWTEYPEKAHQVARYLNDKYELDGRYPNGYTGVSWSIGGLHDRAWKERSVFGKIRYMSYGGAQSKFDVKAYIHSILP